MNHLRSYFRFRLIMMRHAMKQGGRESLRFVGFGAFFTAVAVVIYILLYKAFSFFAAIEVVGEFVNLKLLSTIFFIFFIFLVISNINSVIKWFFTREDLTFLLANPLSLGNLFLSRSIEAIIESSWAFLVLSIPILLAYYTATARLSLWIVAVYALHIPFIIIPHCIAFIAVMLLSRFVSPRAIKNTFTLLSLVLIGLLVFAIRAIQIEKLVRPESFTQLYEYLRFLSIPTHPLIPVNPLIESIIYTTRGYAASLPVDIGFFLSTAAATVVLSYWVNEFFYLRCYTNVRASSTRVRRDLVAPLFCVLPRRLRNFFLKEIKNIQRDPKEWSQVFLVVALVAVYVYNFKLFPKDRSPLPTIFLESILSYLNMGLLTFVVAAISVRFIYPSLQSEGKAFWIVFTSPVDMKELYRAKLLLFVPPVLLLGLALNLLANIYISTPPLLYYSSFGYVILVGLFAPVLSLYLGTRRVDFRETPNPYGGMGGMAAMLLTLIYAGVTLLVFGWGSMGMLLFSQGRTAVPLFITVRFVLACSIIVTGTAAIIFGLVKRSLKNLEKMEL